MKVAVVGLAQSTHDNAPYNDPEWQCWGLAWDPSALRMDCLFEMHDRADLEARRSPEFWDRLREFPGPVYMQEVRPDVPGSVSYPLLSVRANVFAGFPRAALGQPDWFNCSIAYMLALSLLWAADEIGLWGVDIIDSEYGYERACLEYLIGLAVGRGVKVRLPGGPTALCRLNLDHHPRFKDRYGYVG